MIVAYGWSSRVRLERYRGFSMTTGHILIILVALLVLNALSWATYRWDKRQAQLGRGRISERTLLRLAWCGGWIGALIAVYGHRRRHKARKMTFLIPLWLAASTWLAGLAAVAYWFFVLRPVA